MNQVYARIILRYGVGIVAGAVGIAYAPELSEKLLNDPDVVLVVAAIVGVVVEGLYARAKKTGGKT